VTFPTTIVLPVGRQTLVLAARTPSCAKLAAEIGNNEEAKDNLKRINETSAE
jgi:hypothetical protein